MHTVVTMIWSFQPGEVEEALFVGIAEDGEAVQVFKVPYPQSGELAIRLGEPRPISTARLLASWRLRFGTQQSGKATAEEIIRFACNYPEAFSASALQSIIEAIRLNQQSLDTQVRQRNERRMARLRVRCARCKVIQSLGLEF